MEIWTTDFYANGDRHMSSEQDRDEARDIREDILQGRKFSWPRPSAGRRLLFQRGVSHPQTVTGRGRDQPLHRSASDGRADVKWGQLSGERLFQRPGETPSTDDPYTHESVQQQLVRLPGRDRIQRLLQRRSLAPEDDATGLADRLGEESPLLAGLVSASVEGRAALGTARGGGCGNTSDLWRRSACPSGSVPAT